MQSQPIAGSAGDQIQRIPFFSIAKPFVGQNILNPEQNTMFRLAYVRKLRC